MLEKGNDREAYTEVTLARKLTILLLGYEIIPKTVSTRDRGSRFVMAEPICAYLIETERGHVLFDTGVNADNIRDPVNRGDHHRVTAGHAFQQDVGPAFMGRDEQQEVGRAVNLGKAILRHPAEQTHTVGDFALARQFFDAGTFGPLADDHELNPRQVCECLDD